jgi:hypothetical protein
MFFEKTLDSMKIQQKNKKIKIIQRIVNSKNLIILIPPILKIRK